MSNSSSIPIWLLEVKDDISKTNVIDFKTKKNKSIIVMKILRSGMN